MSARMVSALGGVSAPRAVSALAGCLLLRGVSARGVSAKGGLLQGGLSSGGSAPGGYIPACTEADTPPPCGQTDTCENITLAQLHCGR